MPRDLKINISEQPLETLNSVDYKVGILRKVLDRYSAPGIAIKFDLSLAEWRVISHVYAGKSVTARWLCDRLYSDKSEVSRACSSLSKKGYISAKRHPTDARSQLLELTSAGKALYKSALPVRASLDDELLGLLSESEKTILLRSLDKLTSHIAVKLKHKAISPKRT